MEGLIKYKILKERKVVIHCYGGKVCITQIKENALKLMEDEDFSPDFDEITDLRNSELVFNHKDDILNYIRFLKTKPSYLSKRKIAVLTNSPDHVVKSTLYKGFGNSLPMRPQVFSTFESIKNYLDIPDFSEQEFNYIVSWMRDSKV